MPPVERSPDVFRSSMPFLCMEFAMMALIMVFPPMATWLPAMSAKLKM